MLTSIAAAWLLASGADSVLLRVLTINDFHGALESRTYPGSKGRPVGGIAALKGMMDSLAADCRCPTLRLDAGDEMQGTLASNLVYGRSSVEALSLLGLSAAAVGNHDLDWGPDTLAARMKEATYPWLAANIIDSTTGRPPAWARAMAVVSAGPWRIGVVGYLTPLTKTIVMDRQVRGLLFPGGRAALAAALDAAHAARPDLVMIVAHEGAYCDSTACAGEIVKLSRQLDSGQVDLIVAGHTHTLINTTDRQVPIVSARANGSDVGVADLMLRPDGTRHWQVRVVTVYADAVRADSAAVALVDRYRPLVDRLARRVIFRLGDTLMSRGRGENTLGNLIADAQRHAAPADFALMNNGGIRRALLPGPVTYGDLFELHPFGNVVVRVELTGAELKPVLEHALNGSAPDAHLSGLIVRYDMSRPEGDRVVEMRSGNGRRIDPRRHYRLALSDFLAGGGGGYAMLRGQTQFSSGKTDLESMIAWVRRLPSPVRGPKTPRWIPVPSP